ncbi:hypothetical protein F5051DRAFT_434503, partial [Lentinula edodes]
EYALAFAPLLAQTAKISEMLQKLEKEPIYLSSLSRFQTGQKRLQTFTSQIGISTTDDNPRIFAHTIQHPKSKLIFPIIVKRCPAIFAHIAPHDINLRKYRPLSLVMEMRLPALFNLSTNTVDIDRSSDSDSSRTMDSYDSAPQSPSDAGQDDPMPLAPLNPQTMPQMAPQVPASHFHTQSPHPPQTPPPQTPPPQTPPPQTPPPQTPPPQTPPPRSEDFQMDDVNATPRAPPDMTPRAPPGPRNQPIMQQPPSPTIQKGKRRRVHDPEPGPSQSNNKTPGAQPTSHTGAQSNTQSNSQGPVDYLQALLNHQTKTMGELYHHLQNSTAEILQKQDQVLQKQDHKIEKVVSHLAQNTEILGRIGETLDMLSGKSKHKESPGHRDGGDSQRHGSGSKQGPQPSHDGDAAANPSDGGAAGSTTNRNNGNGDGEDGDDEGDSNENPFFRYARKKQPARSGGVKHRPAEELKIKVSHSKVLVKGNDAEMVE